MGTTVVCVVYVLCVDGYWERPPNLDGRAGNQRRTATLENVAVHPDHQGRGIGSALLDVALGECRRLGVRTLRAWTREDEATLRWYRARGFSETFRYLHVYGSFYRGDLPDGLSKLVLDHTGADLVGVFLHAPIEREAEMRAAHRRVYVDRSFVLTLGPEP